MLNKSMKNNQSITAALYQMQGIHYVNLVSQNDEITG